MPRKLVTLVVVVLVGVLVAVGVAVAGTRSQGRDRQTLRFAIKFSPFFLLDLGELGPSRGDVLIDNDLLLKLNDSGMDVGHDGLACTVTDPSQSEAACQGSFVLPGGQITVQFLNSPPAVKLGAITGGTGRYRTARGQMKLVEPATGNVGSVSFSIDH